MTVASLSVSGLDIDHAVILNRRVVYHMENMLLCTSVEVVTAIVAHLQAHASDNYLAPLAFEFSYWTSGGA